MDATTIGIALGLFAAAAYALIRALRQSSFDIAAILLVFLAGFSVPGGGQLIRAALSGDPSALPSSWREYVAVAGIAAIGLSLHFLVKSFRNIWAKKATVAPSEDVPKADAPPDSPAA